MTKYMLEKGDYVAMNNYFENTDWNSIFLNENDVDVLWDKVEHEIQVAKDKFIPTKVFKKKSINHKKKFPIPNTLLELFH